MSLLMNEDLGKKCDVNSVNPLVPLSCTVYLEMKLFGCYVLLAFDSILNTNHVCVFVDAFVLKAISKQASLNFEVLFTPSTHTPFKWPSKALRVSKAPYKSPKPTTRVEFPSSSIPVGLRSY
eukprot:3004224-Amphidinium_carterae.1